MTTDYVLNAYVWGMGHDEADELALEIADLLARRGYALQDPDSEDPMKSLVALCPVNFTDEHDNLTPEEIFEVITSGSRVVVIPTDGRTSADQNGSSKGHEFWRAEGT